MIYLEVLCGTMLSAPTPMKHGYGNIGAVPISSTVEVRILPKYRYMRTQFFPKKKKNLGMGLVLVRAEL